MSIRSTILTQMATVAALQRLALAPLRDDLPLLDTGLDSLALAILVANLEDELELDPFAAGRTAAMPKTVGEFIALYEAEAA